MGFLGILFIGKAQDKGLRKTDGEFNTSSNNPNFVRFNFLALLAGKVSIEYERLLSERIGLGVSLSVKPKSDLTFKSTIIDIVNDQELNTLMNNFKTSSTSITPELRIYFSNRGHARGFYMAPFLQYSNFKFDVPYDFDVYVESNGEVYFERQEQISLQGNMHAYTAGISLGFNFRLSKNMYLDWRIFGPSYGMTTGNLKGNMFLDSDEQKGLDIGLRSLKSSLHDLPLKIEMDYSVDHNGASLDVRKSPWAGIRSGLSIAYKF